MHTTSSTLLERLRQPDADRAWGRFVALYTPFLLHCCRRIGLQDAEAADAVQDVFVLLLDKLPKFEYSTDGSFRAWLRTVTVRKCQERFRRRYEVAVGGSKQFFEELPDNAGFDGWWDADYNRQLVARALELMQNEFEPTTWQACLRTTADGRPVPEVAAELGISVNAVYVARSRVLRRLREELRDLLDE